MSDQESKETKDKDERCAMYVFVNNDLKMGKGKIAGQVGHVVGVITEDIISAYYKHGDNKKSQAKKDYDNYQQWKNKDCYTKIILKATEKELMELIENEPKNRYILDAGRTQIAPGSLTVVGLFPQPGIGKKFSKYGLL